MTPDQEQHLFSTLGKLDERTEGLVKAVDALQSSVTKRVGAVEHALIDVRQTCAVERSRHKEQIDNTRRMLRPWYIAIIAAVVTLLAEGLRRLIGAVGG